MNVRVECDMNELIYIYMFSTEETVLDSLDKCISPCPVVLGKLSSFIRFRKCPGRNLFTEISYLERFTKNPEQGLKRTGLINPVRGGMILLRFQDSSVARCNKSTDEISLKDP